MPVIHQPNYQPAFIFRCGHLQTIYPTLFRKKVEIRPVEQRIHTDDGDFLDLDYHFCCEQRNSQLAVISHGLEGNSRKKYMTGMAQALNGAGWDVICFNFRGCSGEMNSLPRLYHSGVTDDLHTVITHAIENGAYKKVGLVGFSMGGNQTLKYLGEEPSKVPDEVKAAVTFSVPCHLADSVATMDHWSNRVYMEYFMRGLRSKVRLKAARFPDAYDTEGLDEMKTFVPFDNKYTGPVHGFKNAADYYKRCASLQFLHSIQIPTLLVQAKDDPFLPRSCYPIAEARSNDSLHLEITDFGGHVGFVNEPGKKRYWMEARAVEFLGANTE